MFIFFDGRCVPYVFVKKSRVYIAQIFMGFFILIALSGCSSTQQTSKNRFVEIHGSSSPISHLVRPSSAPPISFMGSYPKATKTINSSTQTISVRYMNFKHQIRVGKVQIPKKAIRKVKALFRYLRAHNIAMAHVKLLKAYNNNYYEAFADNNSFIYASNNHIYFIYNPVLNPTYVRKGPAYPVYLYPTQGVLALGLRNSRLPNRYIKGTVSWKMIQGLKKIGFVRYIGNKNEADFGIFVYNMQKSTASDSQNTIKKPFKSHISSHLSSFYENEFYVVPLSNDIQDAFKSKHMWKDSCPIPLERLKRVSFLYWDFKGQHKIGNVVVLDLAAPYLLKAYKTFYIKHIPMQPTHLPGLATHMYNNVGEGIGGTSAFYCRAITGGTHYSIHTYGMAIDINTGVNPYIGLYRITDYNAPATATLIPKNTDLSIIVRITAQKGYNKTIVHVMRQAGFIIWGGTWYTLKDYMHFQTSNFLAKLYANLDQESGKKLYKFSITHAKVIQKLNDSHAYLLLYKIYPVRFISSFIKNFPVYKKTNDSNQLLYAMYKDLQAN